MTSFLQLVARHMIATYGLHLGHVAVVFPGKRASLFLNNELARLAGGKPFWSPRYITIDELFTRHSTLRVADPILLVAELHSVFCQITGSNESLDHFWGWGQLLLSDFDDIDKNMAQADKLLSNLSSLHEMDAADFLSPEQQRTLQEFFSNYDPDHHSKLQDRFRTLWDKLGDIYNAFRARLRAQGLAYEGMLYRDVAEDEGTAFAYDHYLFVGFNMMQKAELKLCRRLKEQGRAHFYWDYDQAYMAPGMEAGHFIRQYKATLPNELEGVDEATFDNLRQPKDITFASAATETIQARYVASWLRANNRIEAGARTAIVLADEKLLPTVIQSLPEEVGPVNITTGYPLALSTVRSLVDLLFRLRFKGVSVRRGTFRLRQVAALLRHPYAPLLSPHADELLKQLSSNYNFYPSASDLAADDTLAMVFVDGLWTLTGTSILQWIKSVLEALAHGHEARRKGPQAIHTADEAFFEETLFRAHTLINRLAQLLDEGKVSVSDDTMERFVSQLFQSTSVPFHGEPAIGVQVMGVLETRALDFDHLLVLSTGEGNLPKGVNDSSFIPHSLRAAFELTTVENKVAIYSYYFHRLLQRASDVTLTYNNSTQDGHTGEMSRFMLQWLVESAHPVKRLALTARQSPGKLPSGHVTKDEGVKRFLDSITTLSPTAINTYLRCQKRYFYRYVAGIKEPEESLEDKLDNRAFGNIFHHASQLVYISMAPESLITTDEKGERQLAGPLTVTPEAIARVLKSPGMLERYVDEAFAYELYKDTRIKPDYNGQQLISRGIILSYLRRLLTIDARLEGLTMLGLEKKVDDEITISVDGAQRKLTIIGTIDRLDRVSDEEGEVVRVIDYKTGRPTDSPIADLDDMFSFANVGKKHSDYYLQTLLYSLTEAHERQKKGQEMRVSPGLLFIQQAGIDQYDPTLSIGGEKITDAKRYETDFYDRLKRVLGELLSHNGQFEMTDDNGRCVTCPYLRLCGQTVMTDEQ